MLTNSVFAWLLALAAFAAMYFLTGTYEGAQTGLIIGLLCDKIEKGMNSE